MKFPLSFIAAAFLITAGCKEDPARSVKIAEEPVQPAGVTASPAPANPPALAGNVARPASPAARGTPSSFGMAENSVHNPAPNPSPKAALADSPPPDLVAGSIAGFCPPLAEDSPPGPGSLVVDGPCAFQHKAPVICEPSADDFIAGFVRKAKNAATLVFFLNVEHYHGPGAYDGAQMFVAVQSEKSIQRWSSDTVHAVVSPGETSVTLPPTRLSEEPALLDCSRLIGPDTNYQYQCAVRGAARDVIGNPPEIVAGMLQCGAHGEK